MTTPATARPGLARAGFVLGALFSICAFTRVDAQTASTGIVEGRVLNVTSGSYLNNARITVNGTTPIARCRLMSPVMPFTT